MTSISSVNSGPRSTDVTMFGLFKRVTPLVVSQSAVADGPGRRHRFAWR
jgi:hypothetical protein